MGNCSTYKPNTLCGESVLSQCVEFQDPDNTIIPSISSLSGENCVSVDEALTDLYSLVEANYVDLSGYDGACLSYSPTTTLEVLNKHKEQICALNTLTTDYVNVTADISNLDISCLQTDDPCGDPRTITNLEELLQALIEDLCDVQANCCT